MCDYGHSGTACEVSGYLSFFSSFLGLPTSIAVILILVVVSFIFGLKFAHVYDFQQLIAGVVFFASRFEKVATFLKIEDEDTEPLIRKRMEVIKNQQML